MPKKTFIIAISAISGGGKTTITRELCNRLSNAKALYFDHYEYTKQPDNICEWVENGSDPNEWDLSLLVNDLMDIIQSENTDYIILDYPFARQNYPIKDFIDMTVFIETPLDIALARRIIRDYKDATVDEIMNDLNIYLSRSRRCFTEHSEKMKSCDVIVDGNLAIDEIVNSIIKEIKHWSTINTYNILIMMFEWLPLMISLNMVLHNIKSINIYDIKDAQLEFDVQIAEFKNSNDMKLLRAICNVYYENNIVNTIDILEANEVSGRKEPRGQLEHLDGDYWFVIEEVDFSDIDKFYKSKVEIEVILEDSIGNIYKKVKGVE